VKIIPFKYPSFIIDNLAFILYFLSRKSSGNFSLIIIKTFSRRIYFKTVINLELLKTSLLISILGLILLYIISLTVEPKQIEKVSIEKIGKEIKIYGKIDSVRDYDKISYIILSTQCKNSVVFFKDKNLTLKKGMNVNVYGDVQDSDKGPQINAYKIELVEPKK
jgi:hypothetical protein